jgi:hypothetical protein
MATKKGSDNRFPVVRLTYEDDTPATPPADEGHLVAGVDKVLRWIDDTGATTELGGAGAAVLDDLTDVDTTGVADGDVLTYDSGGSEWLPVAPTGGGGGGGRGEYASKYNPDHETPATTPAIADEFNGSISGSWAWTTTTPGVLDATTYPGYYHIETTATTHHWLTRAWAPGATDITLAAKLSVHNIANANTALVDIGCGSATGSTPAEAAQFRIQPIAGNFYSLQAVDTTASVEAGNTARQSNHVGWDISSPMWIRLTRTQSTGVWRYYYSLDGITWSPTAYLGTRTKSLTIASIFLRLSTREVSVTLDWIRAWTSIVTAVGA